MIEAAETGTPVIRPMLLNYSHDPIARNISSQFLLGDIILMAPILK